MIIRKERLLGMEGGLDTPLGAEKYSTRTQDSRDFLKKVWNYVRLIARVILGFA
jgi:hypothetical protein